MITYPYPLDTEIDKKIIRLVENIGGEWYSQGTSFSEGVRDICFDLEVTKD